MVSSSGAEISGAVRPERSMSPSEPLPKKARHSGGVVGLSGIGDFVITPTAPSAHGRTKGLQPPTESAIPSQEEQKTEEIEEIIKSLLKGYKGRTGREYRYQQQPTTRPLCHLPLPTPQRDDAVIQNTSAVKQSGTSVPNIATASSRIDVSHIDFNIWPFSAFIASHDKQKVIDRLQKGFYFVPSYFSSSYDDFVKHEIIVIGDDRLMLAPSYGQILGKNKPVFIEPLYAYGIVMEFSDHIKSHCSGNCNIFLTKIREIEQHIKDRALFSSLSLSKEIGRYVCRLAEMLHKNGCLEGGESMCAYKWSNKLRKRENANITQNNQQIKRYHEAREAREVKQKQEKAKKGTNQ